MQRLELTWIGKDEQPQVESRILLHDPSKDYGDPNAQNMLIHGDNLLALKALEQQFAGQVKCIYIDPPYNTGNDFIYADDFRIRAREYVNAGGASQDDKNRMYQNLDYSGRYHSDWCSMIMHGFLPPETFSVMTE